MPKFIVPCVDVATKKTKTDVEVSGLETMEEAVEHVRRTSPKLEPVVEGKAQKVSKAKPAPPPAPAAPSVQNMGDKPGAK